MVDTPGLKLPRKGSSGSGCMLCARYCASRALLASPPAEGCLGCSAPAEGCRRASWYRLLPSCPRPGVALVVESALAPRRLRAGSQ